MLVSATQTAALPSSITAVIRMAAAVFDFAATDRRTGETVRLDLAGSTRLGRESLAVTLCRLYGIGTEKQYATLARHNAAETRAEWKRLRTERKSRKAAKAARAADPRQGRPQGANHHAH